ncbi:hypothetical protein N7456_003208 [Penicillium angulare]|uniref:Uncharacterized protein n=1 Tax=Penicillium angulare TaxID=116970 RepID=A0A9W9FUB9_9EURO|nr:hypothetical protein N7456_003208 [Penicillium angulare]
MGFDRFAENFLSALARVIVPIEIILLVLLITLVVGGGGFALAGLAFHTANRVCGCAVDLVTYSLNAVGYGNTFNDDDLNIYDAAYVFSGVRFELLSQFG